MQNFNLPSPVNAGSSLQQTQQTNLFVREATTTAAYWTQRFKAIRSAQRLYAFAGFIKCSRGDVGPNKGDSVSKTEAMTESNLNSLKSDVSGGNYVYTKVRTCENQMQAMYPYKTTDGRDGGQSESQQRTKLEVALEVAKNVHWEFFLDMDGTIVFKPPFYNLDVRTNEPSVVRDIDIINYTRTETEQGAITSMYVTARPDATQQPQSKFGGWWIDWPLALTIGLRHEPREEWRIMSASQAKQFAQAELVKHNAMLDTLEITIPGRPELRLGYPIYIEPLDSFYYVYNIDHTIQTGGTFTTTLALKSKRSRIRDASGKPRRLLAAVQSSETGQDQKVMQNEQPCPTRGNSALQILKEALARSEATSDGDMSSSKGKSIRSMNTNKETNSEAEAKKRESDGVQAVLDADPCNGVYEEVLHDKLESSTAVAGQKILKQDPIAPGEWVLKENHPVLPESAGTNSLAPVSGDNLTDAIQLSDQQGYKLFGPFLYGRFISMSREGRLNAADGSPAGRIQDGQADPGAGRGDPTAALRYTVNPNIGAVTLRLGSGAVTSTGAGVSGEAFQATRQNSEEESDAKHPPPKTLQIGKVSVDTINNCAEGSVGITAGADTKEARANYAKLRSCLTQGRQKSLSLSDIARAAAKELREGT